ncbi:MAG: HD-GYP domain-containing protein [Trebonia sp.]
MKSPFTLGHSRGVAELAARAATAMGLGSATAAYVRRAGLLHDIGRLGVSNAVWDKTAELSAPELERVRLHPYLTQRMFASSPGLAEYGATAIQHNERLDGSGYPRGAWEASFTPSGRVLAAADAYHAKLEPRPHRGALTPAEAGPGFARRCGGAARTATRPAPSLRPPVTGCAAVRSGRPDRA